ncbi:DNA mismatch repair endonuclease MutL [Bacteroidota bacterium]
MPDIINQLPDSVANQIAAGEVIQRPASVVKELVENAIDAGANEIKVNIKDGGKTLIQVIDNGCGMSETDARMAFERHATSKIKNVTDLFSIRTMGFRGEALASIAAIAEVELKTKLTDEEIGTHICISGSDVTSQNPVSCSNGSNFIIRNLFFNVPARRKFLKTDSTEFRHIIIEFQRIALSNSDIQFSLLHNDSRIYLLNPDNPLKRIVALFGKSANQNLISIGAKTNLVELSGFIGKPEFAKKKAGEQYFFVNNRFMKHPYFNRAITSAYERILPAEYIPSYFIYLDVDPNTIDINIHPTKTEIKFEEERILWQIIQATVKQSLGKFNITPSLDFDTEGVIDIPVLNKNTQVKPPEIKIDPNYNPFEAESKSSFSSKKPIEHWEKLYEGLENENQTNIDFKGKVGQNDENKNISESNLNFIQLKNKFILTPVKSGLMLIDQKRAHERILYEKYMKSLNQNFGIAQQNLFPQTIELNPADHSVLMEIIEDVCKLGFDIRNFGKTSFVINGYPSDSYHDPREIIENLITEFKQTQKDIKAGVKEKVAISLAKASAINYGHQMSREEMREVVDQLFACQSPNYSPTGKKIIQILHVDEIEKKF